MESDVSLVFPRNELLNWYHEVKRDLPWRLTTDPYRIWLSEVILQQTRVAQGLPYYERFITNFPTVHALAQAQEDEVLKLWEGLGYYSRARNLHSTAKFISTELNGEFPQTYKQLLELKGVGPYTAAAIGSMAFGLPVAAVDGNVNRVLARLFAVTESIDLPRVKKHLATLARSVLTIEHPGDHNQAMMELGATVCTPKKPVCGRCPLQHSCAAFRSGIQNDLPVRSKKNPVRNRYFYYCMCVQNEKVVLMRRGAGDVWQGLYQFPLYESPQSITEQEMFHHLGIGSSCTVHHVSKEYVHQLSHQRIHARFVIITGSVSIEGEHRWVSVRDLRNFALPRLITRFIEETNFVKDTEVSNL